MQLTAQQLHEIYPMAKSRVEKYLDAINKTLSEFDIITSTQVAAFLAQIGHESLQLYYTEEIASGKAYEGRQDLGNTSPGDGVRFKGYGFIQVTGKTNHTKCANYFGIPLDELPKWLRTPEGACRSSGLYWKTHNINSVADDILKTTKKVNGGTNGLKERTKLFQIALGVLT